MCQSVEYLSILSESFISDMVALSNDNLGASSLSSSSWDDVLLKASSACVEFGHSARVVSAFCCLVVLPQKQKNLVGFKSNVLNVVSDNKNLLDLSEAEMMDLIAAISWVGVNGRPSNQTAITCLDILKEHKDV